MKRFYLLIVGIMAVLSAAAQTSLLATLSHEGNVTSYYGADALKSAYNEAADGDVITLSSGQFNATNIEKALTIRGAGCVSDPENNLKPTFITGNFTIGSNVLFEGIYSNFKISVYGDQNVQFIKCRLKSIYNNDYCTNSFLNCRITDEAYLIGTATCINSVIKHPRGDKCTYEFMNCVISDAYTYNSNYTNCVIISGDYYGNSLSSSNMANYCISPQSNLFNNIPSYTNKIIDNTDIFESYSAKCEDYATYKLTEEAKAIYIGDDGKEIGIYGGMLPYSPVPSNPQIKKFNVAEKSTADGKLSIDITVGMPE